MKKIDVHCHAFPDFLAPKAITQLSEHSGPYKPFTDGTISGLLKEMDKYEIEKAFIANIATKPEQSKAITQWSKEIMSKRIVPLGSIHPASNDWKNEISLIKEVGLPGIKLHPMYQEFSIDESRMLPIYECIAANKLFILFHAGYDIAFPQDRRASSEKILHIKRMFPELTIIAAHIGGWQMWEESLEYIIGQDIYIETSFLKEMGEKMFYTIIRKHDTEKILFGSDSPWTDIKTELNLIETLNLPFEIKTQILYENAYNLLKISEYKFL